MNLCFAPDLTRKVLTKAPIKLDPKNWQFCHNFKNLYFTQSPLECFELNLLRNLKEAKRQALQGRAESGSSDSIHQLARTGSSNRNHQLWNLYELCTVHICKSWHPVELLLSTIRTTLHCFITKDAAIYNYTHHADK